METSSASQSSALPNPNIPTVRPVNSTAFKRENRRALKESKRQEKLRLLLEDWAPIADQRQHAAPVAPVISVADWSLKSISDQNREPTEWKIKPRLPSPAQLQPLFSPEVLTQKKALRLCGEFFAAEYGSDEEDLADEDRSCGKSYNFFKGLFDKEADLRDFYLKDREKGEFYCLVCGGVGEKRGKKFVGLVAVAQHANFISKTKRIMVHRAYGRVVCEMVGLKIDGVKSVYTDDDAGDKEFQDEEALEGAVENAEGDSAYLMDCVDVKVDVV